jgi:hypothetical protein
MSELLSQLWALFVIGLFLFLIFAVPVTFYYYICKIADEKRLSLRDVLILVAAIAIVCAFVGFALRN